MVHCWAQPSPIDLQLPQLAVPCIHREPVALNQITHLVHAWISDISLLLGVARVIYALLWQIVNAGDCIQNNLVRRLLIALLLLQSTQETCWRSSACGVRESIGRRTLQLYLIPKGQSIFTCSVDPGIQSEIIIIIVIFIVSKRYTLQFGVLEIVLALTVFPV